MDRIGADFHGTVEMMKERLNASPLILQLPIGSEDSFSGVVDLVNMEQITWDDETLGANYTTKEIPPDLIETAQEYRDKLIELLADTDDDIMEAYIAEEPIDSESIHKAIHKATIEMKLVPILCGAALKNKGIQKLLDAIIRYLPSPVEVPPIQGMHPETGETLDCVPRKSAPLTALIFKVSIIEGRKLSFVRIYSGKMKAGGEVYNPTRKIKEKLSRILMMHANKRERVDEADAGSIVGIVGLKDSSTGETLCDINHQIMLEDMDFYEPVISIAIEPKTHADQEKMEQVLEKFTAEDPTLVVKEDEDTGQTILSGMGELHLEIIISRMMREFKTSVNIGKPQVVYREAIEIESKATAEFDREVAGHRQYAEVSIKLIPQTRGSGNSFKSEIQENIIPEEFIPAIRKGIMESLESGAFMGYQATDIEAVLTGGKFKDSLGSELAYTVCASMACREALINGNPYLLEPIMDVEIFVPESFMGEVIGDINARSGKIESVEAKKNTKVIRATVPLSQMFGYSTSLRSASQGRGTFTMQFSHFDRNNSN